MKRVTRHSGGAAAASSVEEARVLPASRKGTAAALTGGKRAAVNDARPSDSSKMPASQSSRRVAAEKPAGSSASRKAAKSKRTASEEPAADSRSEGGPAKRRRLEENAEEIAGAPSSGDVVRHGVVVEEEVVESSEVQICEDEPPASVLENDKKTHRLLSEVTSDTTVPDLTPPALTSSNRKDALSQHVDRPLGAESAELVDRTGAELRVVSKDLGAAALVKGQARAGEQKSCEMAPRGGDLRKDSDRVGRSPEYFTREGLDAAGSSEVFSDDDDVENLRRIEQRCASVQSWAARHSLEEEPGVVDQMDVEDEVTVEGGGGLMLVETREITRGKVVEITGVIESGFPAVAAGADLRPGDVDETARNERTNEGPDIGESAVAGSLITADVDFDLTASRSANINDGDEACGHQPPEAGISSTPESAACESRVDGYSSEEPATSTDPPAAESRGVVTEAPDDNIPHAVATGATTLADEIGDSDRDTKCSVVGRLSDASLRQSASDEGTESCSGLAADAADSKTVNCEVAEPTPVSGQTESGETKPAVAGSRVSNDEPSSTVSPGDSCPPAAAVAAAESDADSRAAHEPADDDSENPPPPPPPLSSAGTSDREVPDAVAADDEVRRGATTAKDGAATSTESGAGEAAEAGATSAAAPAPSCCPASAGAAPVPGVQTTTCAGALPVSLVVTPRSLAVSTVAGSGAPAATTVVSAGPLPPGTAVPQGAAGTVPPTAGFVGPPPVAIRAAAVPGGSVLVHVADPRQLAMHLQQQQQQQQGQTPTPVFHIPAQGAPQIVMSPLSPHQVKLKFRFS